MGGVGRAYVRGRQGGGLSGYTVILAGWRVCTWTAGGGVLVRGCGNIQHTVPDGLINMKSNEGHVIRDLQYRATHM